jgi:DNA-directed RNA polymerase subunit F
MKKNDKENSLFSKMMVRKSFWDGMLERSYKDGSPFAVWQQIRLCNSTGDNLPKWAMDELNRMAKKILSLEKVKSNNYGEFLAEAFNLNGSSNKSARGNREIIKAAFKIEKRFDSKPRDVLIDDLINIDGLSEKQAQRAWKFAKHLYNLRVIFPADTSDLSEEDLQKIKKKFEDWKKNLPE